MRSKETVDSGWEGSKSISKIPEFYAGISILVRKQRIYLQGRIRSVVTYAAETTWITVNNEDKVGRNIKVWKKENCKYKALFEGNRMLKNQEVQ